MKHSNCSVNLYVLFFNMLHHSVQIKPNTKVKRMQADRDRMRNIRDIRRRQREEDMAAVSEIR